MVVLLREDVLSKVNEKAFDGSTALDLAREHGHDEIVKLLETYGNENRNSMDLESLATELETLRAHWETTSKNNRLSNKFEFEDSAPVTKDASDIEPLVPIPNLPLEAKSEIEHYPPPISQHKLQLTSKFPSATSSIFQG